MKKGRRGGGGRTKREAGGYLKLNAARPRVLGTCGQAPPEKKRSRGPSGLLKPAKRVGKKKKKREKIKDLKENGNHWKQRKRSREKRSDKRRKEKENKKSQKEEEKK